MSKVIYLSITLFTLLSSSICLARQVYYGSETENISIVYGGPTILRFNEPVKTISQASRFKIEPADTENPNYSVLSVTPRFSRGKDKVSFILSNGAVVNTRITTVPKSIPERTDSFYDFKPKELLLEQADSEQANGVLSEIELMKAMIRGDDVSGYSVKPVSRLIDTGIPNISARLVRVYSGPKFNGYIFKIKNHSKKKNYLIDLGDLSLGRPNTALLSQVDEKKLESVSSEKNWTHLRIVAKPTSVYYNINLPVAPIIKK